MESNFYVLTTDISKGCSKKFFLRLVSVYVSNDCFYLGGELWLAALNPQQLKKMEGLPLCSVRPIIERDDPGGLIREQLFGRR